MRNEILYIKDISECIERIQSYTKDGKDYFFNNRMAQDAVIRNFEIIGEATKRLSQNLREKYN